MAGRSACRLVLAVLFLAAPVASFARVDETKPDEPVEIGVQERVEVRLVLIDVLVLDHDDRTVPGLEKEDFDLRVSGKRTEIETLDVNCPVGATGDARAERRSGDPVESIATPGAGRIVLAFDYFHMVSGDPAGNRLGGPTALGATADALRKGRIAADQIMVVSMGERMRIETPFTSDRDLVLQALERMGHDPMLYAGPRGITEFRFFRRLRALLDLMEGLPGRKAVVLFSGPLAYDGFNHDIDYARLSAMAATSRTAFYPVDTGGLRVLTDPDNQPLGGQPMLRRIADETGGRMTSDTNDLALGFARAGRDLGCIYTLGFHEHGPKLDKGRRITVRFRRKDGLRAVYPGSFVVRSPSAMAESLFETAIMSPESFVNAAIHADLEIGAPVTPKKRGATLVVDVELKPTLPGGTGETRELRAFVRRPSGAVVRSLRRRLPDATAGGAVAPSRWSIRDELKVRPGRYVLHAIVSDPGGGRPFTAVREVVVPEFPGSGRVPDVDDAEE